MKKAEQEKTVDTDWFKERMQDLELSGRKTAQMLGINQSTFNRLINGHRRWQPQWVRDMGSILGVPLSEMMRRIGTELPRESKAGIPLAGVADETGAVAPRKPGDARLVDRPGSDLPGGLVAVRVQAPGSVMDGWVAYYEPQGKVSPDAVGRLALVTLRNKGGNWLGILKRGYTAGKWNVWLLDGRVALEDVDVDTAAPVLWIRG